MCMNVMNEVIYIVKINVMMTIIIIIINHIFFLNI